MANLVVFLPTASSHNGPGCFCPCFIWYFSELHYLLSECCRLTLDKSPDLSAPSASPPSLPKLLHRNLPAQKGRAGSGTSQRQLFLSQFPLPLPLPPIPRLRQCDIYRGRVYLLGSPRSFWRRNTEGSGEQAGGVFVRGGLWKGWKVEKWGLRIATQQQQKGSTKTASSMRSRKNGVIVDIIRIKWIFSWLFCVICLYIYRGWFNIQFN